MVKQLKSCQWNCKKSLEILKKLISKLQNQSKEHHIQIPSSYPSKELASIYPPNVQKDPWTFSPYQPPGKNQHQPWKSQGTKGALEGMRSKTTKVVLGFNTDSNAARIASYHISINDEQGRCQKKRGFSTWKIGILSGPMNFEVRFATQSPSISEI